MHTDEAIKPRIYGGIDPGADGAAVLRFGPFSRVIRGVEYHDADGRVVPEALRMALWTAEQSLTIEAVDSLPKDAPLPLVVLVVEDYVTIPGQGLASQAKAAHNAGVIRGVVASMGRDWTCHLGLTHSGRGGWRSLAGIRKRSGDKGCIKRATIRHVRDELPGIDLRPGRCTTDQDGIADAAGMSLAAEAIDRREREG